jgi:hypothetical protein
VKPEETGGGSNPSDMQIESLYFCGKANDANHKSVLLHEKKATKYWVHRRKQSSYTDAVRNVRDMFVANP